MINMTMKRLMIIGLVVAAWAPVAGRAAQRGSMDWFNTETNLIRYASGGTNYLKGSSDKTIGCFVQLIDGGNNHSNDPAVCSGDGTTVDDTVIATHWCMEDGYMSHIATVNGERYLFTRLWTAPSPDFDHGLVPTSPTNRYGDSRIVYFNMGPPDFGEFNFGGNGGFATLLTPRATGQTAWVQVNITPAGAAATGRWKLNGDSGHSSGEAVATSQTSVVISYTNTAEWAWPPALNTMLTNGVTNVITAVFTQKTVWVRVNIQPQGAVDAGATWTLDGVGPHTNGAVVAATQTNVALGFNAVTGWTAPPGVNVNLATGITNLFTAVYTQQFGWIRCWLNPTNVAATGQWRVVGATNWMLNGDTTNVAVAGYTLTFGEVADWTKPDDLAVGVTNLQTNTVNVLYTPHMGAVRVTIEPAAAVATGAQWRLLNGPDTNWQASGGTVGSVTVGPYTVTFKDVFGWATPSDSTVQVANAATTATNGVYIRKMGSLSCVIEPAELTNAPLWYLLSSGPAESMISAAVTNLAVGRYVVAFNETNGWQSPPDMAADVAEATLTTVTGAFAQLVDGAVKCRIYPASAVAAGAMWRLTTGADTDFKSNGVVLGGLAFTNYWLEFATLNGWAQPSDIMINVATNATYLREGAYQQLSSGRGAVICRLGPSNMGVTARWRLSADPYTGWRSSGVCLADVPVADYVAEFEDVIGWGQPADRRLAVSNGFTTLINADYTELQGVDGFLFCRIAPTNVTALAQWGVASGAVTNWYSSGTGTNLAEGVYTQVFALSSGAWRIPPANVITVAQGRTTYAHTTFTQAVGGISCFFEPAAVTNDARWTLTNAAAMVSWQTNGAIITNLPVGSYEITFTNLFGYRTPANIITNVRDDQIAVVTAAYVQVYGSLTCALNPTDIVDQAFWQGSFATNWYTNNAVVGDVPVGRHTITFSPIEGWVRPLDQTAEVTETNLTSLSGNYTRTGLLMRLKLDEITNTMTVADATGMHHDGINYGADVYQDGKIWRAYYFSGTQSYIRVGDFSYGRVFSLSFWFKAGSPDRTNWCLFSHGALNESNNVNVFLTGSMAASNPNSLIAYLISPQAAAALVIPNTFADNQWHLCNVIAGHTNAQLFVDAVERAAAAWNPTEFAPASSVVIGGRSDTNSQSFLRGYLDDARIYNYPLTAAEIADLYAATSVYGSVTTTILPVDDSLRGQWRLLPQTNWMLSGETTNILVGFYTQEFAQVDGWIRPDARAITVGDGAAIVATGLYMRKVGSFTCVIWPADVTNSARWTLGGGSGYSTTQVSGVVVTNLAEGIYTCSFSAVSGWLTPAAQAVSVTHGELTQIIANYNQVWGYLTVNLGPQGALMAGAAWMGGTATTWQAGGTTVAILPGTNVVRFNSAARWNKPQDSNIVIAAGQSYTLTVMYGAVPGTNREPTINDFDGDGITDLSLYTTTGVWKFKRRSDGRSVTNRLGGGDAMPVPGDYDGDGIIDPAVYYPYSRTGQWEIISSVSGSNWFAGPLQGDQGGSTSWPVPWDYDGDRVADLAVYTTAGAWIRRQSWNDQQAPVEVWGQGDVVPLPGDYNGDGNTELAVYQWVDGKWYVSDKPPYGQHPVQWGYDYSSPVPRDYDLDGKTEYAIYHANDGLWYIYTDPASTTYMTHVLGGANALPIPGDYNGDGYVDPAVYNVTNQLWYIINRDGTVTTNSMQ